MRQEKRRLNLRTAWGPAILSFLLLVEVVHSLPEFQLLSLRILGAKEVGIALFGPYAVCVELVSVLLLSALVGALHLGSYGKQERDAA